MEFYEDNQGYVDMNYYEPKGIVGFLITKKIAKDVKQANKILIGAFVVFMILSFMLFSRLGEPERMSIEDVEKLPLPGSEYE